MPPEAGTATHELEPQVYKAELKGGRRLRYDSWWKAWSKPSGELPSYSFLMELAAPVAPSTLPLSQRRDIMHQIIAAIRQLYAKSIIRGDVQLEKRQPTAFWSRRGAVHRRRLAWLGRDLDMELRITKGVSGKNSLGTARPLSKLRMVCTGLAWAYGFTPFEL